MTNDDILVTSESADELEVVLKLTMRSLERVITFFKLSTLTVDFPNYTVRTYDQLSEFLYYIQKNIPVPVAPMTLMK